MSKNTQQTQTRSDLAQFNESTPPKSTVIYKGKKTKTMTAGWVYAGEAIVLIESVQSAVPIKEVSIVKLNR